jgi:hypothetical protein
LCYGVEDNERLLESAGNWACRLQDHDGLVGDMCDIDSSIFGLGVSGIVEI